MRFILKDPIKCFMWTLKYSTYNIGTYFETKYLNFSGKSRNLFNYFLMLSYLVSAEVCISYVYNSQTNCFRANKTWLWEVKIQICCCRIKGFVFPMFILLRCQMKSQPLAPKQLLTIVPNRKFHLVNQRSQISSTNWETWV